jgi:spore coat protein U-like protein
MLRIVRILGWLAAVAGIGLSSPGQAVTLNTNLTVTITITNQCTAASTTPVNFGSHGFLSADVDNTGTITVTCTPGATYTVGLNAGTSSGATTTTRKMSGPGTAIDYQLFRETGRTSNWGNTIGTDTVAGTGDGTAQTLTVFGRVPAQATPIAGTYNDTVQVSIDY